MNILDRDIEGLARMARKAQIATDSDGVRWFVAEMTDRNPEEEDSFLDYISDAVWFRLLVTP